MATKKHTAPSTAPTPQSDPLGDAVGLLRTATTNYVERAERYSGDRAALLGMVSTAKAKVIDWGRGLDDISQEGYEALDLITLAEAVLGAGLKPRNELSIDPVMCALRMARELLEEGPLGEQYMAQSAAANSREPDEPVSAKMKLLLNSIDDELTDAGSLLRVTATSLGQDHELADEESVVERVIQMIGDAGSAVEFAARGQPEKGLKELRIAEPAEAEEAQS